MRKIVISGGPHTGKSTLQNALRPEYPQAQFIPEPATQVIQEEAARAELDPSYDPAHPAEDYRRFAPLVLAKSIELEDKILPATEFSFLDRCRVDTIAYCRIEGFEEFISNVIAAVEDTRYAVAFLCDPIDSYALDGVRYETPERALETHHAIVDAYQEMAEAGYIEQIVHLPNIPVLGRVAAVKEVVSMLPE